MNEAAIIAQIQHDKSNTWETSRAYAEECEKWASAEYFAERLDTRIAEKNEKCRDLFEGSDPVQLLLHSDEMYLEAGYKAHMSSGVRISTRRFNRVWLLLSYSPNTRCCPLVEIRGDS